MLMNTVAFQGGEEHVFSLQAFLTTEHFLKLFGPHGDLLDASQTRVQERKLKNIDLDNKYHFTHLRDSF